MRSCACARAGATVAARSQSSAVARQHHDVFIGMTPGKIQPALWSRVPKISLAGAAGRGAIDFGAAFGALSRGNQIIPKSAKRRPGRRRNGQEDIQETAENAAPEGQEPALAALVRQPGKPR